MKNTKSLLFLIVLLATIPFATIDSAAQRDRRSTPTATPSPTPVPSPAQAPAVAPGASPTAAVSTNKTSNPTRTLAELQSRITDILRKPELAPAMVGIKVVSLDTGHVLFEENSSKLLRPASNMKLYTVATALDRL